MQSSARMAARSLFTVAIFLVVAHPFRCRFTMPTAVSETSTPHLSVELVCTRSFSATLSPAVSTHDTVQYTPTEVYEDGTNLSFVFTAGLPGVGNSNSATNFSGVRLPFCFADLANGYLSCEGLRIGATYEVQQDRNGAVASIEA